LVPLPADHGALEKQVVVSADVSGFQSLGFISGLSDIFRLFLFLPFFQISLPTFYEFRFRSE